MYLKSYMIYYEKFLKEHYLMLQNFDPADTMLYATNRPVWKTWQIFQNLKFRKLSQKIN